jgi:hypothetical protein
MCWSFAILSRLVLYSQLRQEVTLDESTQKLLHSGGLQALPKHIRLGRKGFSGINTQAH